MLVALSKACPDEKYQYWFSKKLYVYYLLAGFNILKFAGNISFGFYFYSDSKYGILSFLGLSIAMFEILSSTPLIIVIIISYFYVSLKATLKTMIDDHK